MFLDAILLLLLLLSFINVIEKPSFPFKMDMDNNKNQILVTEVTEKPSLIRAGDIIISVNSHKVNTIDEIEYITDWLMKGDKVSISIKRIGEIQNYSISLVKYYDYLYLVIFAFTLSIFIWVAIYVISRNPNDTIFRLFHNLAFSSALLIGMTLGKINFYGNFIDYILRFLYDFSQIILSINLLHFFLVFPKVKYTKHRNLFRIFYSIGFILGIIVSFYSFQTLHALSLPAFRDWTYYKQILIALPSIGFISLSLYALLHSYNNTDDSAEKRKIRWILIGTTTAVLNFVILWQIPKLLFSREIVPEWLMILVTITAPISIFIAIFRYRLFDIDFLISRSYVYLAILGILFSGYFVLSSLIPGLKSGTDNLYMILIILFIIVVLQPIKNLLQAFVDKKFFRQSYDYKVNNQLFTEKLKDSYTIEQISELLLNSINESISLEKLGFIIFDTGNNNIINIRLKSIENVPDKINKIIDYSIEYPISLTISKKHAIEEGYTSLLLTDKIFDDAGIHIVMQSLSDSRKMMGLLLIGLHTKRIKFSHEDIDAMRYKLDRATSSIQRIILTREITLREEENEKLAELNKMKSFFVSSVSHELKTPLTSIRLFAELLQINRNLEETKKYEYLEIIQSECDRLNRLINNVLDYSQIERGVKQYYFDEVNLIELISTVKSVMDNQIQKNNFEFNIDIKLKQAIIYADKDSIIEVLINLISNSIKYSDTTREITISLEQSESYYVLTVADKGVGMSEDDLQHIFEAFYRAKTTSTAHAGGAGIGLSLVKSIIIAHGGTIKAESELNKGTRFILTFPIGGSNG